jgi:hypothetical protein
VHKEHFFADPEDADYEKEMKKQGITVKVAQHLARKLSRAPFSAPWKVAVIPDAEDLNPDAQNVLLKTLEEPPAGSLLILIAKSPGSLLPTVLSRCRILRFPALSDGTLRSILMDTYGQKKEAAERAVREAGGNLTLALRSADPEWIEFREKVRADLDRGLSGTDLDWLLVGQEYEKWEPGVLGERERTATQRKAELGSLALQVYLGLWTARRDGNEPIPQNLAGLLPELAIRAIREHQDLLDTNLGLKMVLDRFFMQLREARAKGVLPEKPLVGTILGI